MSNVRCLTAHPMTRETPRFADRRLRFGDIVENGWASEENPTRFGVFVRKGNRTGRMNAGPYVELTDTKGKFWQHAVGSGDKLSVVGRWPDDWPVVVPSNTTEFVGD